MGAAGAHYVCGIDVADQDSALAIGLVNEPGHGSRDASAVRSGQASAWSGSGGCGGRDATVATIGRVRYQEDHEPVLEVVAGYPLAGDAHAAATTLPTESQVIPPEEDCPHTGEDWTRVW